MRLPLVSLVCVVRGPIFERYARALRADVEARFLPGECEWAQLEGRAGWPDASSRRYEVILEHWSELGGEWVFLIDADSRVQGAVGREILADGLTVTTHPGFPPDTPADGCPYSRDPASLAYVPPGHGRQYHPGAFVGGSREAFGALAGTLTRWADDDRSRGVAPVWYDESYLNKYLLEVEPPALVLDRRYCWWQHWGLSEEALIVHLDKTSEEFRISRGHPAEQLEELPAAERGPVDAAGRPTR